MKNGFTLSEVLITLVVIGIVAIFTIPSLDNHTRDIELKANICNVIVSQSTVFFKRFLSTFRNKVH